MSDRIDLIDFDDMEPNAPQTESSKERGFEGDADVQPLGHRDELSDDDHPGDIADEGPGHRG